MPIEIKELHIRVAVDAAGPGAPAGAPSVAPANDTDAVVAACVEQAPNHGRMRLQDHGLQRWIGLRLFSHFGSLLVDYHASGRRRRQAVAEDRSRWITQSGQQTLRQTFLDFSRVHR